MVSLGPKEAKQRHNDGMMLLKVSGMDIKVFRVQIRLQSLSLPSTTNMEIIEINKASLTLGGIIT